ncbi:hypothetical protein R3X26_05465 [Vibrio sp. TH_r3]|uniref:hypothetical protein n=1 Tax=Vibrio sp. TH_r3 TaxID=3082084 RepID=UPI002953AB9F|nr:hypothetical protein [Vibrio sp. TH_r3]MDV7103857.1 hypothetical protein [Vibrio sp. TH_r3]
MAKRKKDNLAKYWFRQIVHSPVMHLVVSTLLFGAITFLIFLFTIKWDLLPLELSTSQLSQENTGLFDALGGWALGFAGALVAIRIASLAASIQQNDSIREQVNLWANEVERISELNSRLTRATYDAKRACAAVLLHAEKLYRTQYLPPRVPEYLNNSIYKTTEVSPNESIDRQQELEQNLQTKLEQKIEVLVEVIEEASKDALFRDVLKCASEEQSDLAVNNNEHLISEFFIDEKVRKQTIDIIDNDQHFFNILDGLQSGVRNFGIGLMELRAKDLFEHFHKDLMRITELQQNSHVDESKIEISDAAWLFLGLLLLRSKGNSKLHNRSENHGFIFIPLLLGSIPTGEMVENYLNKKATDVEGIYSKDGMEDIRYEISLLSKRLYFVKGDELSDLIKIVSLCSSHLEYLEVFADNTGISSTKNKDENDQKGSDKSLSQSDKNESGAVEVNNIR